jgi:hypothetical protein
LGRSFHFGPFGVGKELLKRKIAEEKELLNQKY